jgi:hypothetical protein
MTDSVTLHFQESHLEISAEGPSTYHHKPQKQKRVNNHPGYQPFSTSHRDFYFNVRFGLKHDIKTSRRDETWVVVMPKNKVFRPVGTKHG